MNRRKNGFTLAELMVTVLVIGILSYIAIPQYNKTVEYSKADDAVSTIQMVGTTNRMLSVDSGGVFSEGLIDDSCNSGNSPDNCTNSSNPRDRCDLIRCNYLARQSWSSKPYTFCAMNGAKQQDTSSVPGCSLCANLSAPMPPATGPFYVACAARNGGSSPYNIWGYTVDTNGLVTPYNGAPPPPP